MAWGLAIANIRNPKSGVGHYVVLLGEKEGLISYYCPLHGKVIDVSRKNLIWTNSDGTIRNWVINLDNTSDIIAREVNSKGFVFILGDDKNTLNPDTDTSLLLQSAYIEQGTPVFWVLDTSIALIGETLYLNGLPVGANDLVWIRLDPVNTVRYYEIMRLLAQVENVTFLNSPSSILLCHDKLASSPFREKR